MRKVVATATFIAAMALAAPVHAAGGSGLAVNFNPGLGGMNVTVTETAGVPVGQNCTYTAVSVGGLGSLVPPNVDKPFQLATRGSATLSFPGIPTGTKWQVIVRCELQTPAEGFNGGDFNDVVTY